MTADVSELAGQVWDDLEANNVERAYQRIARVSTKVGECVCEEIGASGMFNSTSRAQFLERLLGALRRMTREAKDRWAAEMAASIKVRDEKHRVEAHRLYHSRLAEYLSDTPTEFHECRLNVSRFAGEAGKAHKHLLHCGFHAEEAMDAIESLLRLAWRWGLFPSERDIVHAEGMAQRKYHRRHIRQTAEALGLPNPFPESES